MASGCWSNLEATHFSVSQRSARLCDVSIPAAFSGHHYGGLLLLPSNSIFGGVHVSSRVPEFFYSKSRKKKKKK
jgi:hypothetical protein